MWNFRGGDVADDAGLYQTLYRLTEITGDGRYADAADASLRWFLLRHVNETTGLPAWGEHAGIERELTGTLDIVTTTGDRLVEGGPGPLSFDAHLTRRQVRHDPTPVATARANCRVR